MTLQKAFEVCDNRLKMIGLFLGMLELMRNHLVWVEQPDTDGPIYLKPLTSEPAEEAVHNAIYSNPEAMEVDSPEKDFNSEQEDNPIESADEVTVKLSDDEEDEDEFSKALSSIQVPSEEPDKPARPRIPIMELPAEKQQDTSKAAVDSKTRGTSETQ
jgi:hypothetical protein